MSSTFPGVIEHRCLCGKFTDRCFRRPDQPNGLCFPCSTGNCGLGGNHGYGAIKATDVIEVEVIREIVPEPLQAALRALEAHNAKLSLAGDGEVYVPVQILQAIRIAWWDYVSGAEHERSNV